MLGAEVHSFDYDEECVACTKLLKNEFYYVNHFDDEQTFLKGLAEYIKYYNNDRIKLRLNMSPVQYRQTYMNNMSKNMHTSNNIY